MKKIKILFAVIVAVGLGFTVSAFQTPEKEVTQQKASEPNVIAEKSPVTEGWFRLVNPSAKNLASSYEYEDVEQPCDGASELCAIKAAIVPNSIHPSQSDVNAAKTASDDFANPVPDMVAFEE